MPRGLCCLPIQVKSKYYPIILLAIFTLFFGPQFSLIVGCGVGYLYVFGYVKFLETSAVSLKSWEESWPFKSMKENRGFRKSNNALQNIPNRDINNQGFISNFMGGGNRSQT